MRLKELEGKRAIRTRPREWTEEHYDLLNKKTTTQHADRSFVSYEIEILKVTEGLAYYKSKRICPDKVYAIALYEYDDGFWEESQISQLEEVK